MYTFARIWSFLEKERKILNTEITKHMESDVKLNKDVCNYIVNAGGKRIRPLVFLLMTKSLKNKSKITYDIASAIEFIHTATLLHDDVVDESDLRRGKRTVNFVFGNAAAVLVGDFLYTRAFQLISQNLTLSKVMADATNKLAKGEVMQLMNINNINLSEAEYLKTIYLKTAVLFSAACEAACIISNAEVHRPALSYFGEQLGYAFQIADDILDYKGDVSVLGKRVGDDLREQKLTLPLIYALSNAKEKDRNFLKNTLENRNIDAADDVKDILINSGAIEYASKKAKQHASFAKKALHNIDDSKYKDMLMAIPDLAIKRSS